ncbi:hypothetical protein [Halomicronema sp. CCY15110]|uniref:hypothetical protein n=1 Tax=Halomicronema sp. CCY15110 TaxID=2767773 RepID=UPI0019529B07|nr:hypothetical protein [Halomicronema sp. CCY15110]
MTPIKIFVISDHAKAIGIVVISPTQSILILGKLGAAWRDFDPQAAPSAFWLATKFDIGPPFKPHGHRLD